MKITWFGTASVSIETENGRLLFDPFVPLKGSRTGICEEDFTGFDTIFLTHGHVDHLASLPRLMKNGSAHVWCTKTPSVTLKKKGVPSGRIHEIKPGDTVAIGVFTVQALQGWHIVYDRPYVMKTLLSPRILRYFYNLPWLLYQCAVCRENGETLAYAIKAEGKTILLLGSLGYDPDAAYPAGADLLILPFQGASDLATPALEIIGKVCPKRILTDHFDDTFPPVSNTIPLDALKELLKADFPETVLMIPEYRKPVCI